MLGNVQAAARGPLPFAKRYARRKVYAKSNVLHAAHAARPRAEPLSPGERRVTTRVRSVTRGAKVSRSAPPAPRLDRVRRCNRTRRRDMAKFLVVYRGGNPDAEMDDDVTAAWMDWFGVARRRRCSTWATRSRRRRRWTRTGRDRRRPRACRATRSSRPTASTTRPTRVAGLPPADGGWIGGGLRSRRDVAGRAVGRARAKRVAGPLNVDLARQRDAPRRACARTRGRRRGPGRGARRRGPATPRRAGRSRTRRRRPRGRPRAATSSIGSLA